jgi:PTS system nitrogen regulatory IIA component
MDVKPMLKVSSIRCEAQVKSKKHALDLLSHMLAEAAGGPTAGEVMTGLVGRERLGSTGLGEAIAMPHTRLPGVTGKVAALLKLAEPVDFGAPDGQPVDLLFGLLVPEDSRDAELSEVHALVRKLSDPELKRELRSSSDPSVLQSLFGEL